MRVMSGDTFESLSQLTGVGSMAVVSGVICCLGLKLIGGAVLFGGLGALIGISADQTTFLLGGAAGLLLAIVLHQYRDLSDLVQL